MVMKRIVCRKQGERGFTILFYALMITVVLAFTGLAVDVGYLQWQQRLMQGAADAAAMGALREMELGRTDANPKNDLTTAAQGDAALNGFTNGQNSVTVSFNNPPTSGTFQGQTTAGQVVISKPYPTFFMRILGTNSVTLSAQAVAQTTTSFGSIGGCIFALAAANEADALNLESGTTLNSSCSAISESNNTEAFKMAGSDTWNMTSHNAHVGVVGGYKMAGSATIVDTTVTPNVTENPVTITSPGDPLINTAAPTTSTVTGGIQSSNSASYSKNSMPANNTLNPGIYCGGISVGNTGGNTLKFNPGIYVLAGGGFTLGSQSKVSGTGVTFYSTYSSGWGCSGGSTTDAGVLWFDGQATANFTAPTSGTCVGMLFFQDRTLNPGGSKIVGGSGSTFDGALYFKKSSLQMAGNNSTSGYMVIVANTIDINGATKLGNNYTTLSDPNPFAPGSTGGGLVY